MYKRRGETPLQALNRFRIERHEYKDAVLSYVGRLDPMADGILLVVVNEENKHREKYLHLDKEYTCEILFGIETDTYDVLGIIKKISENTNFISEEKILELLKNKIGTFQQKYPPYSSQPVKGKPLFEWARENKLSEIEIPTKEVTIYDLFDISFSKINSVVLLERVIFGVSSVVGDFRQEQILESWKTTLNNVKTEFLVAKMTVKCSSGTYIRSFAHNLGRELKTGALALSISRTKMSYPHI